MAERHETGNYRLFGLPSTTIEYEYQGKQHLLAVVRRTMEQSWKETPVIFSGLDPPTYRRDIENTDCWRLNKSFDTYLPQHSLLLLEMPPSDVHETTSQQVSQIIMDALPRRIRRTLIMKGTRGYRSTTKEKSADQAFVPRVLPPGRSDQWPTMVIECGWSETRAKLERDCRWWLQDSDGEVKIALSVSIHMRRKQITIQKWESFQLEQPRRSGRVQVREKVAQSIVISQTRDHPIRITGAPLRLEFDKLFLRRPLLAGERDIEILSEDLRFLAQLIWEVHPNV